MTMDDTEAVVESELVEEPEPAPGAAAEPRAPAGKIAWYRDFTAAVNAARRNQIVFVDVYTDWCTFCKFMDRNVFTHPSVVSLAERNVFVKINAEDGGTGTRFAQQYDVQSYPTLFVFDAGGELLKTSKGAFRTPGEFVAWVESTGA
jgi:thiol:disulfide interchange protein